MNKGEKIIVSMDNRLIAETMARLWVHRRIFKYMILINVLIFIVLYFVFPLKYKTEAVIIPNRKSPMGFLGMTSIISQFIPEISGQMDSSQIIMEILKSKLLAERAIEKFDLLPVLYGPSWQKKQAKLAKKGASLTTKAAIKLTKKYISVTKDINQTITFSITLPGRRRVYDVARFYLSELQNLINKNITTDARRKRMFIEAQIKKLDTQVEKLERAFMIFLENPSVVIVDKITLKAMKEASSILSDMASYEIREEVLNDLSQLVGNDEYDKKDIPEKLRYMREKLKKILEKAGQGNVFVHSKKEAVPLTKVPILSLKYVQLKEDLGILKGVKELLRQQYELAKIEEAKEEIAFTVVDPPFIPVRPSSFSLIAYIILGILSGFIVSIIWIYLKRQYEIFLEMKKTITA